MGEGRAGKMLYEVRQRKRGEGRVGYDALQGKKEKEWRKGRWGKLIMKFRVENHS